MPEGPEIETERLHEAIHEEVEHEGGSFLRRIALTTALFAAIAVNLLNYDLLGRDLFFRVLEYRHYGLAALLVAITAASVDRLPQE